MLIRVYTYWRVVNEVSFQNVFYWFVLSGRGDLGRAGRFLGVVGGVYQVGYLYSGSGSRGLLTSGRCPCAGIGWLVAGFLLLGNSRR